MLEVNCFRIFRTSSTIEGLLDACCRVREFLAATSMASARSYAFLKSRFSSDSCSRRWIPGLFIPHTKRSLSILSLASPAGNPQNSMRERNSATYVYTDSAGCRTREWNLYISLHRFRRFRAVVSLNSVDQLLKCFLVWLRWAIVSDGPRETNIFQVIYKPNCILVIHEWF